MKNNLPESPVTQMLADYLKENRLRRTPERFRILNMIYSIDGSFDIDTLLKHMEEKKFRVSRATVYNTITLLINANLVTHHQFGNKSRYEKCLDNEKCHLICTKCARITETTIHNLKETITTDIKKFHLTHYSLYIYGLCNKCHQAMRRRQKKNSSKKTEP